MAALITEVWGRYLLVFHVPERETKVVLLQKVEVIAHFVKQELALGPLLFNENKAQIYFGRLRSKSETAVREMQKAEGGGTWGGV